MRYLPLLALVACASHQPDLSRSISNSTEWDKYFQDITLRSGVDSAPSTTVVFGDYNNDGKVDFIAHNRLYENTSTPDEVSFLDVTAKWNLTLEGQPMFMDINNDQLLDIITTKGQVYLRKQRSFTESSKQLGLNLPADTFSMGFGDLNNDGYADLIIGRSETHQDNKFTFVPPKIYFNKNGKSFKDVSEDFKLEKNPAYVRGIHLADYDNDGKVEIYFSNYRLRQNFLLKDKKDIAPTIGVDGDIDDERFYDNHHKRKFGPLYGHTIGSAWADMNNDGFLDLFVSNLVHKYVGPSGNGGYDHRGYLCDDSKIYRNSGAPDYTFQNVRETSELPVMPIGGKGIYKGDELWAHVTSADYDNDGFLDFYVTQVYDLPYATAKLFKNMGNFKFKDASSHTPQLLDSYAGAWADLNNDGKMDLIISGRETKGAAPALKVLLNVQDNKNNYLKVKLMGKKSGTIPVATQVKVFHEGGVFLRQVDGVTGTFNQQNDPVLHFGLGEVSKITRVEVRWTGGKKQIIGNAKINSLLTVAE